jgi:hypothetical protein
MIFASCGIVRHRATLLGLIATLVARCCTLLHNAKVMFCVNRGPFLTSPLGVNLVARGEICPLVEISTPRSPPGGEHCLLFRRMEGRTENFTPRGQNSPWGTKFPLGDKIPPGGQLRPWGSKLRVGLRPLHTYLKNIFLTIYFSQVHTLTMHIKLQQQHCNV